MRAEDAGALAAYHADPAYLANYTEPPEAAAIVASARAWAREKPRRNYQFAVVLKSTDAVIGCAGLRQKGFPNGEAEVGVEIDPGSWRRGFARETLTELIRFGAAALSIETFWAITTPSNEGARALVGRFGFRLHDETANRVRLTRRADG